MDDDALVAALAGTPQGFVIVNTRRHALDLYRAARAAGLDGVIHLSTRQCAAHRRKILDDVKARLKAGEPCRLIATSVVEAGVDIDFPRGWRAEAGLDSIIQAAGRVNREGKRNIDASIVTVFRAPNHNPPQEVKDLIGNMEQVARDHGDDLQSLAAIEAYFAEVYWHKGAKGLDAEGILDAFRVTGEGTNFAFREVAQKFRMIKDGGEPVIVVWDDVAAKAVEQLSVAQLSSGKIARKLQSYVVQVPPKDRAALIKAGHVAFVRPDLRGDQFAVLQTASRYDPDVGLVWEDAELLGSDESVW